MSVCLFISFEGSAEHTAPLLTWARNGAVERLIGAEPITVEAYVPEAAGGIVFDDGAAPALMIEFRAEEAGFVLQLIGRPDFASLFKRAGFDTGCDVHFGFFDRHVTPVAGETIPAQRIAPVSFVVRYYGPMPDEEAFARFYLSNHPPILGKFPDIRNVLCYTPRDEKHLQRAEMPVSPVRFCNEVVFDDVGKLTRALGSDVLTELRADSRNFPPFGHSTHHAMRRFILLGDT